jgi:chromosome segregation ATPase
MSAEETYKIAERIAKQIESIKSLSEKRVAIRAKLNSLNEEISVLRDELNKVEDMVKSIKHEITNDLSDSVVYLKLVDGE